MRAPDFWRRRGAPAVALWPLSLLWRAAGGLRSISVRPRRAPVPVICIGNLVAGGAGKTPLALAVAELLSAQGRRIHFLTRGHGGRTVGPLLVEPARHDWREVGDEALLLAAQAPTWVARDRVRGAVAASEAGAEIVVMDDGFQNPGLVKDLSFLAVDGLYGFGNGWGMPAGPLREPVGRGLARAQAVVLIGEDRAGVAPALAAAPALIRARLAPLPDAKKLAGRRVLGFAGIGRPEKFFATLDEIGCKVQATMPYPDHHAYSPEELWDIFETANAHKAQPVTTEKDAVRLPPEARAKVKIARVFVEWENPEEVTALLARSLAAE